MLFRGPGLRVWPGVAGARELCGQSACGCRQPDGRSHLGGADAHQVRWGKLGWAVLQPSCAAVAHSCLHTRQLYPSVGLPQLLSLCSPTCCSHYEQLYGEALPPEGDDGRQQQLQDKLKALILKKDKIGAGARLLAAHPAASGGSGGGGGPGRPPSRMVNAISTMPGHKPGQDWITSSRPADGSGLGRRTSDENELPLGGGRYRHQAVQQPPMQPPTSAQDDGQAGGRLWRPQEAPRPSSSSSGMRRDDLRASLSSLPAMSQGRSQASRGPAASGLAAAHGATAPLLLRQLELKAALRPPAVEAPHKSPWRPPGELLAAVDTRLQPQACVLPVQAGLLHAHCQRETTPLPNWPPCVLQARTTRWCTGGRSGRPGAAWRLSTAPAMHRRMRRLPSQRARRRPVPRCRARRYRRCGAVGAFAVGGARMGSVLHAAWIKAACPAAPNAENPAAAASVLLQGISRLAASSGSLHSFHGGSSAAATPRQPAEDQVVYELALPGSSPQHGSGIPTAALGGAKRSLGDEIVLAADLEGGEAADVFDGLGDQGAATGDVFHGLDAAVGTLGGAGAGGGLTGAGAPAAAGFTTAGLQHLAAKLRNGSMTPDGHRLQPAGGSGRYASCEDSVGSKQSSAAPGSVGGMAGAGGSSLAGLGGSTGRARVPALHLSRVSVSDLLHGGGVDGGTGQGQPGQLHSVSRQMQASISRLAQSMHGSGMAAVTTSDIHAALSGAEVGGGPLAVCGVSLLLLAERLACHRHASGRLLACVLEKRQQLSSPSSAGSGAPPPTALHDAAGEFTGESGTGGGGLRPGLAQNLAAAGLFATPEVSSRPLTAEGDYPNLGSPAWPAGGHGNGTAAAAFGAALAAEVSATSLSLQPPQRAAPDCVTAAAAEEPATTAAAAAAGAAEAAGGCVSSVPLELVTWAAPPAAQVLSDLHLDLPGLPAGDTLPAGLLADAASAALAASRLHSAAASAAAAAAAAAAPAGTDWWDVSPQAATPAAAALAHLGSLYLNEKTGQIMQK